MTLKDCFKDDLDKIFLNDCEFAIEIVINSINAKAVVNFNQDLVNEGDKFYAATEIHFNICNAPLSRCQQVIIDGEIWIAYRETFWTSRGYFRARKVYTKM